GFGASANLTGTVGLGMLNNARQLALTGRWNYANSRSDRLEVKHSGFMLEAILYEGPGRFFRFKVRYDLEVQVRHEKGTLGLGGARVIGGRFFPRPADGAGRREFATDLLQKSLAGEATFVIVEKLAPTTPLTREAADRVGQTRNLR